MKLRLGLIGLGPLWESRYRPALRALSDRFQVTAVFEQVAHRAIQAAREFDAAPVTGVRAVAQRPDVDAVLLLSKQWMGTLPIVAAADAGKAIYCANHLDLPADEAQQLRDRVDRTGIAFMSELPRRHAPATIRLKELIATKLGKPHLLFGHIRRPSERRATGKAHIWTAPPSESPLADLVEQVDWVRYVVGREPTSVIGLTHRAFSDPARSDYEMMSVDFSSPGELGSGPVAQISVGNYVPSGWEEAVAFRPPANLQVACEKGIAFIDLPSQLIWFDDAGRHQESLESERPLGEMLLLRFYRSVTALLRQTSSLDDTCRALEVVLAARRSQTDGQRIFFDESSHNQLNGIRFTK